MVGTDTNLRILRSRLTRHAATQVPSDNGMGRTERLSRSAREVMNVPVAQPRLSTTAVPSQNAPGTIELDMVSAALK